MATFKYVWVTLALVVILVLLEKGILEEQPSRLDVQESHENLWLSHTRQKRNDQPFHTYEVDVELNLTDIQTLDEIRIILRSLNITGSDVTVTDLKITTVCSPNGTDFLCRCEDPFVWSGEKCLTYGACSQVVNDSCTCISSIPADGQYCEPADAPPAAVYEYQILVEVNTTVLSALRNAVNSIFPLEINRRVNSSEAVITTVCSPSSDGFQCRCEDEYRWSCDQCQTYQPCDNVTNGACGCISRLPDGGLYCLAVDQHDFTECGTSTTTIATTTAGTTNPPDLQEYLVSLELNVTDGRLLEQVRNVLTSRLPFITHSFQISAVNISTVCVPSGGTFQCTCEDGYRWACDQCQRYESCDGVINDTCGCVSGIPPDGDFCRSVDEHNFTECNTTRTTAAPPTDTTSITTTSTSAVTNETTDVTTMTTTTSFTFPTNSTPVATTNMSTTTATTVFTTDMNTTSAPTTNPPDLQEYLVSLELNVTDGRLLEQVRNVLTSRLPFITHSFQISAVNISTVCVPSGGTFQCTCEDGYRWACDQCQRYNSCDGVINDTCGCVSGIPPDGDFCRSVDEHNFTECNTTRTTAAPPTDTTSITTTSTSAVTNETTDVTTITTTTSFTFPTNSTPVATTNMSTTTATTVFTTDMNTTSAPTTNPPDLQEYLVSLELNVTDGRLLEQVRNVLTSRLPFITHSFQISAVNISTVCVPSGGTFQCTCEDGYRWACDQCQRYNSCDGVINDTCGCVIGIPPDGDFCRSVDEHNFTECNTTRTTAAPPTDTTSITTTSTSAVTNETTDVTTITTTTSFTFPTNSTPVATTNMSTTTATTVFTTDMNTTSAPTTNPPDLQEYLVSLELNVTDGRLLEQVRNVLTSRLPFITHSFQISAVNISTVCVPSGGTFQCTCEDGYRWACDQCQRYESCDGVINDTCGCVSGIPPDGDFCRSVDEHNFTECNTTRTTAAPPTDTTSITTTSTSAVTNSTSVATTNMSTTDMSRETNATTVTAAPTTKSTTVATTHMSTTTATASTTGVNTTVTSAPTTKSTTVATTHMSTTTTVSTTDVNTTVTATPTNATVSPTGVNTTNVTAAPTSSSTKDPTFPTTLTTEPPVTTVSMSVTLDLTYTEELANSESERYIDLESRLNDVFTAQYQTITGFREVSVTGFRPGSVIVDFTISTTAFSANEITNVNENLPSALSSIAPVIGRVVAQYNSQTPIEKPETTFTTQDMMLTCGPPEVNVGDITDSEWKFNGLEITGERREIALSGDTSTLTVRNVIQSDNGVYECTLKGNGLLNYVQRGVVPADVIIAAPVVRLQNRINTQCEVGRTQPLECCVQDPFEVIWVNEGQELESAPSPEAGCITSDYTIESCNQPETTKTFTCQVDNRVEFSRVTRLTIFNSDVVCNDNVYGRGRLRDRSSARCGPGQQGTRTAVCEERAWKLVVDTCILTPINDFLIRSEDLSEELVPEFAVQFNKAVQNATEDISQSPATIDAVVQILNSIANATAVVSENVTQNVLEVLDVIIGDDSRESWIFLNSNETRNTSSSLLGSMETLAERVEGIFTVETPRILFSRTAFNDSFMADLNSSVFINIPQSDVSNVNITTITFPTLDNVMPTRNSTSELGSFTGNNTNETATVINAAVVLIRISNSVPNVTLTYQKLNQSLEQDVQCVFWNFQLFDSLGAWDNQGCRLESQGDDNVTCFCDHLTSFSILMSTNIPEDIILLLDIITYIGVGISMASLVICLIIEGYVWKDVTRNSTAYIRHVSIINTALSLLIANICFIIGAAIAKNESENPNEEHRVPVGPCTTATFFMHFFYLAVFFWMLVSGLLLLYRTVMVFSQMSKSTMLAIGFTLGYVCPLLIAVVTVAATAGQGGYIREDLACWLNWTETRALLAMVIPALIIVLINFVIVIIVLFKMLRRGVGSTSQPDEKNSLLVIIRCVAILTPLFGLTWGLGVGTMISPNNRGIHIAFAFFNSFQGFFILVFGTLLDSKIRALLSRRIPAPTSGSRPTQSTSGGFSSLSGKNIFNRFRRNRNVYHVSDTANSNANSSSASETFINT